MDSYGGDPEIVATRSELLRVANEASAAVRILDAQAHSFLALTTPVRAANFAIEISSIVPSIHRFACSCEAAAESYFSTETRVARELATGLPRMLQENPWLAQFLRPWLALGVTSLGLSALLSSGRILNSTPGVQLILQLVGLAPRASAIDELLGRAGLVKETGVSAKLYSQARPATPPLSLAVLARRLAATAALGQPCVRIERFIAAAGQSRWVVYVPGTQDWSLRGSKNPLDMGSNIKAMSAANLAGSERAVLVAMRLAGVKPGDKVLLVGHSQGGIVAANIASQKQKFQVAGLLTFGSPIARINTPNAKAVIAVQHSNDLVPTLSGTSQPLVANRAVVQSTVKLPKNSAAVAAHNLSNYIKTAGQADRSSIAGLARMRLLITGFVRGSSFGQVTLARIRRKAD